MQRRELSSAPLKALALVVLAGGLAAAWAGARLFVALWHGRLWAVEPYSDEP